MVKNQIKTVLLLGLLTGLILLIGNLVGGQNGLLIALGIAAVMNFVSYWWSDKIVLWMYRAKEADKTKEKQLYEIVQEIATSAKLPLPRIYLIETEQANAFATGRNPQHAVVAATRGLLALLNKNELKGVLAHEMAHVKNRDILVASIAATLAGVISYLAMIARWGAIFGGMGRDNERGMGVVEFIFLAILAPIMAMIIQFAVSRSREYLADETGARFVKDSHSLASALEKIEKSATAHPFLRMGKTEATAHLFIHNPFKGRSMLELFSTHPSTAERIKRLKSLTF